MYMEWCSWVRTKFLERNMTYNFKVMIIAQGCYQELFDLNLPPI